MKRYIDAQIFLDALKEIAGSETSNEAFGTAWKWVGRVDDGAIRLANVVPSSLLTSLMEDILNLREQYIDTCCLCSEGVCDDCNIGVFADELSNIIERAIERKERLTD